MKTLAVIGASYLRFPLVVKPADRDGSTGEAKVDGMDELCSAIIYGCV